MGAVPMLFLVAALAASAAGQIDTSVCNPGEYVATGKQVPTLPKSFYAAVEANIVDKKYTVDSLEVVDEINDIVKIREEANINGIGTGVFTEVFDFKNNQLVLLTQLGNSTVSCTVGQTSDAPDRYLFGEKIPTDGSDKQVFTSQGAWFLSTKFPAIYKGMTTARGIPADWWENCIYLESSTTTVKANWYFTASNWSSASGAPQIPLRLTINGTTRDVSSGQLRPISHSYEFAHFRTQLRDDERMSRVEIPPGVVCPGLTSPKKMPAIPVAFSFLAELVLPVFQRVTTVREAYDSKLRLGRYDYIPDFTTDEVSEMHDFTTGIAYITNTVSGNCTAQPIPAGSFDAEDVGNGKVRMRTSSEFFGAADANYQYSGRRRVRDIPCDVFTALRNSSDGGGLIWEIGFTADKIQVVGGPVNLQQNEPAFITLRSPDENKVLQQYNIIDFDESEPDIDRFRIGQCYSESQKTYMKFKVQGSYSGIVEKNRNLFRYLTLLSLMGYTASSPLRFSQLMVRNSNDEIVVEFQFLDPPPLELSNLCDDCDRKKAILPTEDVIALLRSAIDSESLVIEADVTNVNNLISLKAIKGSFVTSDDTIVMTDISLDSGAAAGLAVAFLIVGILAAFITLALLIKFRGSNLPPVIKGFVPQTFSSESK